MRVAFGECVVDSETRELIRAGRRLELSPKAFALLCLLLENRPRALAKAAIHDQLWPKTFVGTTNLARLITEVRKSIGDDTREPKFLRTVHGFGYAFSGEVAEPGPTPKGLAPARCSLVWDARAFPLALGENLVGRSSESAVEIASARVSRRHARIVVDADSATLEDLGSRNGTLLGGSRIQGAVALTDGDEITIGPALLIFRGSGCRDTTVGDVDERKKPRSGASRPR